MQGNGPYRRNGAETKVRGVDITPQRRGPKRLATAELSPMVAHIIPSLLGIVAPLMGVGWLLAHGV